MTQTHSYSQLEEFFLKLDILTLSDVSLDFSCLYSIEDFIGNGQKTTYHKSKMSDLFLLNLVPLRFEFIFTLSC